MFASCVLNLKKKAKLADAKKREKKKVPPDEQ